MLNERKGVRHDHPVRGCHRRGHGGENPGKLGGCFAKYHVSLVFSPHRDGLRRYGESGDHAQGNPHSFMPCEPCRYSIRTDMTICNL